jgi:hypothetical protein
MNWVTAAAHDLGVTEAEILEAAASLVADGLIEFTEPDTPGEVSS